MEDISIQRIKPTKPEPDGMTDYIVRKQIDFLAELYSTC